LQKGTDPFKGFERKSILDTVAVKKLLCVYNVLMIFVTNNVLERLNTDALICVFNQDGDHSSYDNQYIT